MIKFLAFIKNNKLGVLSFLLLISLIVRLIDVPGGMFFSAFFFGIIYIIGILLGCILLTAILSLLFKGKYQLKILYLSTVISFLYFHYYIYSPTLTITVQKGYSGHVHLVKSFVNKNQLVLDSNGIGHITEWTFDKTYRKPIVYDSEGNDLTKYCVGYSSSSFWGKTTSNLGSRSLSFELYVPLDLSN